MDCEITCVKYLVFIFNFLFTMAGLGLLVVGTMMLIKVSTLSQILDGYYLAPPSLLIVIGIILFVIAFFGCCATMKENNCMIIAFCICLAVLLLVGLAAAIVAFIFKDNVGGIRTADFQDAVSNYNNGVKKIAVDKVQELLSCCGAFGPKDYSELSNVPESCCVYKDGPCTEITDEDQVFQNGCVPQMKSFISDMGTLIGAMAVGISSFIIVGIVFGLWLASHIYKNEKGDFPWTNFWKRCSSRVKSSRRA